MSVPSSKIRCLKVIDSTSRNVKLKEGGRGLLIQTRILLEMATKYGLTVSKDTIRRHLDVAELCVRVSIKNLYPSK